MRKDYVSIDVTEDRDEATFIEDYWTRVWKEEGGPKEQIGQIPSKNEYKVMAPYLARLPKEARLLDGGCGLGDWTAYFSRNGFPTTGLDISRSTVAKLHELFPDVTFAAGDIRRTEFEDASFDGYFSWGVFEHFEDGLQPCIAEAYRILKPGGFLFVSVPFDNIRHALRSGTSVRRGQHADAGGARFYQWRLTRQELSRELCLGGFNVEAVETIHKRQGVLRSLHHEIGLPYSWLLTKGLATVLSPFIPGGLVAHMVMAIAQKPHDAPVEKVSK